VAGGHVPCVVGDGAFAEFAVVGVGAEPFAGEVGGDVDDDGGGAVGVEEGG